MANFNLWSSIGAFFYTSSGAVNGDYWGLSNSSDGGQPVWVDTATSDSGYSPSAVENYTIVMTSQDWFGDQQALVTIATVNNIIDPFGASTTSAGNLATTIQLAGTATNDYGGIIYWQNSTTISGDYAVEYVPTTTTYQTTPTAGPSTVVSGSATTLNAAVASPTSYSVQIGESSEWVLAYTTTAASGTENLYFNGFSQSSATSVPVETSLTEIATGVPDGTQWFIGYSSGQYYYRYTIVNGSSTGLYGGTFDASTGAVGSIGEITSLPTFTQFTGLNSRSLSNGLSLRFFEGVANGQDVIEAIYNNGSTPSATFDLTSADDRFSTTDVYDPGNGQLDYTVLAYTDNNQVHLELLSATGVQIGADYVVSGISSFDRIHTLMGTANNADTRIEIDYTATDPSGGTQIQGLIYDTATSGYVYTLGSAGNNEYGGSPFNDTITWASGVYAVDGGGGYDTFSATQLNLSEESASINAQGDVVISDLYGDVDTLLGFSTINFSGATVFISGETLTQYNADGSQTVTAFSNGSATSIQDYNTSEILFENQSSGLVYEWLMSGGQHVGNTYLSTLPGWSNVGSFDFYGSSGDGVLWQNQSSGAVYEWEFSNGSHTGTDIYLGNLSGYNAVGVGAFDGAGTAGILWKSQSTGEVYEWAISNGQHTGSDVDLGNLTGWNEVGTGDFTGDGTSNILWQNASSGEVYEWTMSGGQHVGSIDLGNLSGYTMVGSGDFNGDGTTDLLWESSNGTLWEWQMGSSGKNVNSVNLGNLSGYSVAAIGDFNGSGIDSIVWQGASAGDTWLWTMSNGQHVANTSLGSTQGYQGSNLHMS
jgi:hypothetical protein